MIQLAIWFGSRAVIVSRHGCSVVGIGYEFRQWGLTLTSHPA